MRAYILNPAHYKFNEYSIHKNIVKLNYFNNA